MLCFVDEEGKWEKRFTFTLTSRLLSWATWGKGGKTGKGNGNNKRYLKLK
jgi:hypothetical protein